MATTTAFRVAPPRASELDAEERMSRDELRALQLRRLQNTLRIAYQNIPAYRRTFDEVGVHPDDVHELEDVAKLPFTTKDDLRESYPFGMFGVPMDRIARIHASSGTTGRPTVVGYTSHDLAVWASLIARSLRASGVRPGMRVHNAYGYGLFTGGLGLHAGAELLGTTVIPVSGGQTTRQAQLINDFEPDVILGTPSYVLTIADALSDAGIDPRSTSLQVGVFGAEPWTNQMRHELESRLNIDAVDIYGLSEVMGPGVGNECVETKDGPHIWEDHFLPEIVDPITGAPVPDGEFGELVFTTLSKEALPAIRYRTHDLTRLLPGTARPGMRRIEKITGRDDDMIILRGVNLFPSQIEEIALEIPELSPYFILEMTRPNALDQLTVRVEGRAGVAQHGCERACELLGERIKQRIGSTVIVQLEQPGSLERSTGKAKRFYDLR